LSAKIKVLRRSIEVTAISGHPPNLGYEGFEPKVNLGAQRNENPLLSGL
jgi:hypothetical protein